MKVVGLVFSSTSGRVGLDLQVVRELTTSCLELFCHLEGSLQEPSVIFYVYLVMEV